MCPRSSPTKGYFAMTQYHRLPTRDALADLQRRQREDGFLYPLAATSIGEDKVFEARVRRLNTTDLAAIEMLPQAMQAVVWAGIKAFQKLQKDTKDAESLMEAGLQNQDLLKTADAYCIAAFIDPPLVATEAELATSPEAYWVKAIAGEDRLSFFFACMDADQTSARRLRSFRPEAAQYVPGRPAGGVDEITTIGPTGDVG